MITKKQIDEIRALIKKSKNPLYLFDNDPDGLCSFLLLWHWAKKGKGIPSKGNVDETAIESIKNNHADLVLFLDKPVLTQELVDQISIPIIHIDHHPPLQINAPYYHYYNPRINDDKDNRPTSYWAYQVTKENMWIATVGSISDWFLPEFIPQFKKKYPGLLPKRIKQPGQVLFESEFGKLARVFAFGLMGKPKDRKRCLEIFMALNGPYDVMRQETEQGKMLYNHFEKINRYYEKLREEAFATKPEGQVLLFSYPSSEHSVGSVLANELIYKNKDKVVIVARVKDDEVLLSMRTTKIKLPPLLEKALEGLRGGGGGHDTASGAHVAIEDFSTFMKRFKELVKKER